MAIEDYMPDFAVEAVYDLTVESLKRQGIKAVLVDLDNTLIAWNMRDMHLMSLIKRLLTSKENVF